MSHRWGLSYALACGTRLLVPVGGFCSKESFRIYGGGSDWEIFSQIGQIDILITSTRRLVSWVLLLVMKKTASIASPCPWEKI